MPITLQDAVERAKLENDNNGNLSQYMYSQLLSSLDKTEQHAFAMALVDSGVNVKTGRERTRMPIESSEEVDPCTDKGSSAGEGIYALLARRAQNFVQSPGGLWMPSDYDDPKRKRQPGDEYEDGDLVDPEDYFLEEQDPAELMKNVAPFDDEEDGGDYLDKRKKWLTPEQSESELIDESPSDFLDVDTMEYVHNILEKNNISVDSKGMVSLYKSSVPGIYTDKNRMKPMPLEKALQYYQQQLNSVNSEQAKITELQDILTRLKNDSESLNRFQYSTTSKNPMISQLGTGVENLKSQVEDIDELTNEMVSILEQYYEGQYGKDENLMEISDALWNLNEWKKVDPQKFKTVVEGIGAV